MRRRKDWRSAGSLRAPSKRRDVSCAVSAALEAALAGIGCVVWAVEHIAQINSNKNVLQNAELAGFIVGEFNWLASGLEALFDQYGVLPGISFQTRNASSASSCII